MKTEGGRGWMKKDEKQEFCFSSLSYCFFFTILNEICTYYTALLP